MQFTVCIGKIEVNDTIPHEVTITRVSTFKLICPSIQAAHAYVEQYRTQRFKYIKEQVVWLAECEEDYI